jgi:hypothetical protein
VDDADLPGDGLRGERVVAGDDDDPDPSVVAARDRIGDVWPRGVLQRGEPQEAQFRFGLVAWNRRIVVDAALGEGQDAQPALGVALERDSDLVPISIGEEPISAPTSDCRATLHQLQRRAFGVVPQAPVRLLVKRGHPLQAGIEVMNTMPPSVALTREQLDVLAELSRGNEQRAFGRVAAALPGSVLARDRRVVAAHCGPQDSRERLLPVDRIGTLNAKLYPRRPITAAPTSDLR